MEVCRILELGSKETLKSSSESQFLEQGSDLGFVHAPSFLVTGKIPLVTSDAP